MKQPHLLGRMKCPNIIKETTLTMYNNTYILNKNCHHEVMLLKKTKNLTSTKVEKKCKEQPIKEIN